jgi:pterin-4a-carbinolamine dehydratase
MATRDNVHPIKPEDLEGHAGDAEFRMQNVPVRGQSRDLLAEVRRLPGVGGYLLAEPVNHTLHTLRRAVCLYYEIDEELKRTVDPTETVFLSSFALFAMSALVVHELPAPVVAEGEELASFQGSDDAQFWRVGLPVDDHLKSILSIYLQAVIVAGEQGKIENPADLVNFTHTFFLAARDRMIADSTNHAPELLQAVKSVVFRVDSATAPLELDGFSAEGRSERKRAEFNPTLPEQVVGNVAAKRALLRYADRLALYDAQRQLNPILELGGLPSTVLFDGPPGTGKSSLFRMAMTRLQQRAEQVGLPVAFQLIDTGIKDEYYGKTGKQLRERLDAVKDTSQLVQIFFDDIDLLVSSRQGGSDNGSDRDILTITMQFLDGISTRFLGNYQTYAATNEPTALDGALRQRFHQRELIDGPADWDDYAALIGIKLARQLKNGLVQVGGEPPSVALAASTQGPAAGQGRQATGDKRANGLLGAARSLVGGNGARGVSWEELGRLCVEFKGKNERFTGRPIESVTQKLLAEAADFDLPEEWFADPAQFLQKSFDEKVALLKTLYRPITGEMIARELELYFNSEQRYVDEAKQQRVERLAGDMEAQLEAQEIVERRQEEA